MKCVKLNILIFVGNFPPLLGKGTRSPIELFWTAKKEPGSHFFQLLSPRAIMQIRACGGQDQHMCKTFFNLENKAGRQNYKNTLIQTYTRSTCILYILCRALWNLDNVKLQKCTHIWGILVKLVIRISSGHPKIKIISFVKYATFAWFLLCNNVSVSYTHLTLPTIYSV